MQYRLPGTGELIPLLPIAPSKTDKERLLVVSPELADVLSQIISRVRGSLPAVPLISAYDDYERVWLPPAPRLFQRRVNAEDRAFAHSTILKMLRAAVTRAGLTGPDGQPLRYGEPLEDLARDIKRTHLYPSEVRRHDVSSSPRHPRVCACPVTGRGGVGRSRAGC